MVKVSLFEEGRDCIVDGELPALPPVGSTVIHDGNAWVVTPTPFVFALGDPEVYVYVRAAGR